MITTSDFKEQWTYATFYRNGVSLSVSCVRRINSHKNTAPNNRRRYVRKPCSAILVLIETLNIFDASSLYYF
jgi:hypothetical protein